jgi:hypothetical protein
MGRYRQDAKEAIFDGRLESGLIRLRTTGAQVPYLNGRFAGHKVPYLNRRFAGAQVP